MLLLLSAPFDPQLQRCMAVLCYRSSPESLVVLVAEARVLCWHILVSQCINKSRKNCCLDACRVRGAAYRIAGLLGAHAESGEPVQWWQQQPTAGVLAYERDCPCME